MTDWRELERELADTQAADIEETLDHLEGILPFLTDPTAQQVRVTQARLRDERNVLLSNNQRRKRNP